MIQKLIFYMISRLGHSILGTEIKPIMAGTPLQPPRLWEELFCSGTDCPRLILCFEFCYLIISP